MTTNEKPKGIENIYKAYKETYDDRCENERDLLDRLIFLMQAGRPDRVTMFTDIKEDGGEKMELRNKSHRKFKDISTEKYRKYVWADKELIINDPRWFSLSNSGHYIVDANDKVYFIKSDFLFIVWKPLEGEPHMVF